MVDHICSPESLCSDKVYSNLREAIATRRTELLQTLSIPLVDDPCYFPQVCSRSFSHERLLLKMKGENLTVLQQMHPSSFRFLVLYGGGGHGKTASCIRSCVTLLDRLCEDSDGQLLRPNPLPDDTWTLDQPENADAFDRPAFLGVPIVIRPSMLSSWRRLLQNEPTLSMLDVAAKEQYGLATSELLAYCSKLFFVLDGFEADPEGYAAIFGELPRLLRLRPAAAFVVVTCRTEARQDLLRRLWDPTLAVLYREAYIRPFDECTAAVFLRGTLARSLRPGRPLPDRQGASDTEALPSLDEVVSHVLSAPKSSWESPRYLAMTVAVTKQLSGSIPKEFLLKRILSSPFLVTNSYFCLTTLHTHHVAQTTQPATETALQLCSAVAVDVLTVATGCSVTYTDSSISEYKEALSSCENTLSSRMTESGHVQCVMEDTHWVQWLASLSLLSIADAGALVRGTSTLKIASPENYKCDHKISLTVTCPPVDGRDCARANHPRLRTCKPPETAHVQTTRDCANHPDSGSQGSDREDSTSDDHNSTCNDHDASEHVQTEKNLSVTCSLVDNRDGARASLDGSVSHGSDQESARDTSTRVWMEDTPVNGKRSRAEATPTWKLLCSRSLTDEVALLRCLADVANSDERVLKALKDLVSSPSTPDLARGNALSILNYAGIDMHTFLTLALTESRNGGTKRLSLVGANLSNTSLWGVDFRGSLLDDVCMKGSQLGFTKFDSSMSQEVRYSSRPALHHLDGYYRKATFVPSRHVVAAMRVRDRQPGRENVYGLQESSLDLLCMHTGRVRARFPTIEVPQTIHTSSVSYLAISPTGDAAVLAIDARAYRMCLLSGEMVCEYPGNKDEKIYDVKFASHGQFLVTSYATVVKVWAGGYRGAKLLKTITLGDTSADKAKHAISCIGVADSHAYLAIGGVDNMFQAVLMQGHKAKPKPAFSTGGSTSPTAVAINRTGSLLAIAQASSVGLWDATYGTAVLTFDLGAVVCLAHLRFFPEETKVLVESTGVVWALDVGTGSSHIVSVMSDYNGLLEDFVISPAGSIVKACSLQFLEGKSVLRIVEETIPDPPADCHRSKVHSVAISHDGSIVASACQSEVRLWCRETGKCSQVIRPDCPEELSCMKMHGDPQNPLIAVAGKSFSVYEYDARTAAHVASYAHFGDDGDGRFAGIPSNLTVVALAYSDDGVWIASGGSDGSVAVFRRGPAMRRVQTVQHGRKPICGLAFEQGEDPSHLFAASEAGVLVWCAVGQPPLPRRLFRYGFSRPQTGNSPWEGRNTRVISPPHKGKIVELSVVGTHVYTRCGQVAVYTPYRKDTPQPRCVSLAEGVSCTTHVASSLHRLEGTLTGSLSRLNNANDTGLGGTSLLATHDTPVTAICTCLRTVSSAESAGEPLHGSGVVDNNSGGTGGDLSNGDVDGSNSSGSRSSFYDACSTEGSDNGDCRESRNGSLADSSLSGVTSPAISPVDYIVVALMDGSILTYRPQSNGQLDLLWCKGPRSQFLWATRLQEAPKALKLLSKAQS
eukprot:Rmarinus@m.1164